MCISLYYVNRGIRLPNGKQTAWDMISKPFQKPLSNISNINNNIKLYTIDGY